MIKISKIYFYALVALMIGVTGLAHANNNTKKLPNIIWITCEDISPYLGCYGYENATTPNLDKLAAEGIRYTNAFANTPVCSPTRFTLVTGMYASSCGTHNMRSRYTFPEEFKTYPEYLKEAGYYCTNNAKTDYNYVRASDPKNVDPKVIDRNIWDESSNKAHYKNRNDGQPFFAIFNISASHEGQVQRYDKTKLIHDPQKMEIPPYHPDIPEVREDWARLYDNITITDSIIGKILAELDSYNLTDSTIIFFYSDHGGVLPRSKRFIYDTGTRVPLIIKVPEMYKDQINEPLVGVSDRLVSFVDFAPTLLSIAGMEKPDNMQGTTFMGKYTEPEPDYVYFFRGRMDERFDLMMGVCDKQHRYIYNLMPEKIYGQHIGALWNTLSTRSWEREYKEGRCNATQGIFWNKKPVAELYDMTVDPWEVKNLAENAKYANVKAKMHKALVKHARSIKDASLLLETEIMRINENEPVYNYMWSDKINYDELIDIALLSADPDSKNASAIKKALTSENASVRYWAARGLSGLRNTSAEPDIKEFKNLLNDESEVTRIEAAKNLYQMGEKALAINKFKELLNSKNNKVVLYCLNTFDQLDKGIYNELESNIDELLANNDDKYIIRVIERAKDENSTKK